MLYISAQPDENYFLWQLEIQISNFNRIGILPQNIHVLISFKPSKGLNPNFATFIKNNNKATFFIYPDERTNKQYISSIRPHILKKHFQKFPKLSSKTIFYHDSDIIFRERLNEKLLSKGSEWHLSDTNSYMSSSYLKQFGLDLFKDVCAAIDIDYNLVEINDKKTGGAQHVMKGIDYNFWSCIENDCEIIFQFLENHNRNRKDGRKIQSWCADMWALYWNALKRNEQINISEELEFCWPKDHISNWYNTKILHNAGVFEKDKENYFCKLRYKKQSPYYIDFSKLKKDTCSEKFIAEIELNKYHQNKYNAPDFTVIFPLSRWSLELENLINHQIRYWNKNFKIKILLSETGTLKRLKLHACHENVKHIFSRSQQSESNNKICIENIIPKVKTRFIIVCDPSILIPYENILESIQKIQENCEDLIRPYHLIQVLSKKSENIFMETLVTEELCADQTSDSSSSFKECFIMNTNLYRKTGGESFFNYFLTNGFNLERESRMKILGFNVKYITKDAFQINLDLRSYEAESSKNHYIKLCQSSKADLITRSQYQNFSYKIESVVSSFLIKIPFKTFVIRNKEKYINANPIKNEFKGKHEFDLIFIDSNLQESWNIFREIVINAQLMQERFIVICKETHNFTDNYSLEFFQKLINAIHINNLEIMIGGVTGGYIKSININQYITWIDNFESSSFIVLHELAYEKILKYKYSYSESIESALSKILEHKVVCHPFISRRKKKQIFTSKTSFNDSISNKQSISQESLFLWNTK